jgi:flagellar basal-body rod protein FlgB
LAVTDLSIFSMLRTRMQWHQERQRLLAQNVANVDTPNFKPQDLAPLKPERADTAMQPVTLQRSQPGHIVADGGVSGRSQAERLGNFAARQSGNVVHLEDEMIKVAANQMDYQAATTLYSRSLGLIKTAIGKR